MLNIIILHSHLRAEADYTATKKADKIFQSIGVSFPEEEILISFDNKIAHTTADVNYFKKIIYGIHKIAFRSMKLWKII